MDTEIAHHFSQNYIRRTLIIITVVAILAGTGTGYFLAAKSSNSALTNPTLGGQAPKSAQQDSKTFRDFAEGKITKAPEAKAGEYMEGTHLLVRDAGNPVSLTSSVVDLSQYEGKKVRVRGETQKALKAGWLMDVGKVEEIN